MEIRYTCSEADFVGATMLLFRKRQKGLIAIIVMCAFTLCYAILEVLTNLAFRTKLFEVNSIPKLAFGFGMPTLICLIPLLTFRTAKRTFRRTPSLSETRVMTFGDGGFSTSSESSSGFVSWSLYSSFYEDKKSFLLMQQGERIFLPIPKRELASTQVIQLRSIFQKYLVAK